LTSLALIIVVLGGVLFGGYMILDKIVVPRYLSTYGISNMGELVTVIHTMYSSPKESQFILNPYCEEDKASGISKLKNANFPYSEEKNTLDYDKIAKEKVNVIDADGVGYLIFTDREIAAVLDDVLRSGAIADNLDSIASLDTLTMTTKEVVVTPKLEGDSTASSSAHISMTIMINTAKVRGDMAKNMDVPTFLLNMIVPKDLYFTCEFNISTIAEGVYEYSDCVLRINGATTKQSEILINLLIGFIFEPDQEMTMEKLSEKIGGIITYGLELFGRFEFVSNIGEDVSQNGLKIYLT